MDNLVSYRTKDGSDYFQFSFEQERDGSIRAYIESMPSYGGRSAGLHETHRLSSWGRHYVCWSRPIHDSADLKKVVGKWCESTQRYIRTGTRF
jgi:hypothetical protein